MAAMTRDEWIAIGVQQKWCLDTRCLYHDGTEPTLDELTDDDPCVLFLQLIDND